MKRSKAYLIFIITLFVGVGLFVLVGILLLISSPSSSWGFEEQRTTTQFGVIFSSLIIADLVYFFLYLRFRKLGFCSLIVVIPLLAAIVTDYYFDHGNLSVESLPAGDYRHFRGTKAYELISQIVDETDLTITDLSVINYLEPNSGMTPLSFCIVNGYYEAAIQLLDNGADPNLTCIASMPSPIMLLQQKMTADKSDSVRCKHLLQDLMLHGADTTDWMIEADHKNNNHLAPTKPNSHHKHIEYPEL